MRSLVVLILVACGGDFAQKRNQDLATKTIWHNAYGFSRPAPPIEWVHADRLWTSYDGGVTLIGWKIQISCGAKCDREIDPTVFAHELFHWACFLWTGDVDIGHRHCDWKRADDAADRFQHCLYLLAGGRPCQE